MTKQDYKDSIRSLSACSIPVMLAVVGWNASAGPVDLQYKLAHGENASVRQSADLMNETTSQGAANWVCMAPDNQHFWISRGQDATISTYRFTDQAGDFELLEEANDFSEVGLPASFSGEWIDLELSDDGQYLYQLFGDTGTIGVYEIDGGTLTLAEVLTA